MHILLNAEKDYIDHVSTSGDPIVEQEVVRLSREAAIGSLATVQRVSGNGTTWSDADLISDAMSMGISSRSFFIAFRAAISTRKLVVVHLLLHCLKRYVASGRLVTYYLVATRVDSSWTDHVTKSIIHGIENSKSLSSIVETALNMEKDYAGDVFGMWLLACGF
jgi:hypothetical protein